MIPLGLRMALRHLTIVPIPWDARESATPAARALPWFPVVGLAIGGAAALVLALPIPTLPRAALALTTWSALSGALHEDGLMDCADAALPPVPRERRLEILKDPRVGALAVVAESLLLLLRFSALTVVSPLAPIVAAVTGRWAMTLTLTTWRAARPDGMGARYAEGASGIGPTVVAIVVLSGVIAAALLSTQAVAIDVFVASPIHLYSTAGRVALASLIGAVCALGTAAWLSSRFGGLTGDAHGAAGVIAETAALFAFLPLCGAGSSC